MGKRAPEMQKSRCAGQLLLQGDQEKRVGESGDKERLKSKCLERDKS